ncbi:MAG: YceI family protein [Candidatus Hydrogenedentes bacterium]|nr:YceI family protein [Candidatus Hydrogenedentota bacterium]
MFRKTYITLICLAFLSSLSYSENYIIDPVHSSVWFKVLHLNISSTYGAFPEPQGVIYYDPANPSKSSVEVEVDVSKVNTLNPKRDEHLRSADFFDVQNYPKARFKGSVVEKTSDNKYKGKGILNFRGIEKEIEFEVWKVGEGKDRQGEHRIGFEAGFTIKRSDFGMSKYPPPQISDEVNITVALEAEKQK